MPRLTGYTRIANSDGTPSELFLRYVNSFAKAIDEALAANESVDTTQTELIATLNETVSTLNDVVEGLQAQAAMVRTRDSTPNGLTVDGGAGGSTSITVSSHTRSYQEPTEVKSVTGDTITGLTTGTTYYIHDTDTSYAGGAVGYQTSDTLEGAMPSLVEPYRHFVGKVETGSGAGTPDPAPYYKKGLT